MPPNETKLETDLVIIGGGAAGLAVAHVAAQRELRSIILEKGTGNGTASYAATGLWSPRSDYLSYDVDYAKTIAEECASLNRDFPTQILKPRLFIIPFGPNTPYSRETISGLLKYYDRVTERRLRGLPGGFFKINNAILEKMEPNLSKEYTGDGIGFWEWTFDPELLLNKLRNESLMFSSLAIRIVLGEIQGMSINAGIIKEVVANDINGRIFRISNRNKPIIVINAAGAWANDILSRFGIKLDLKYRLGVQIKVPGWHFQSGVISFTKDGKYFICLQQKDYLQIGPTNTLVTDDAKSMEPSQADVDYLVKSFEEISSEGRVSGSVLKHGLRVEPQFIIDTHRPVIWHHDRDGVGNLYSVQPGKLAGIFVMARDLFTGLAKDGWIEDNRPTVPVHSLDGNKKTQNNIKLVWLRTKSLILVGWNVLRYLLTPQ